MKRFYSILLLSGLIITSCNNEQSRERDSDNFDYEDSTRDRNNNPGMDSTRSDRDTLSSNFTKEDSTFLVEALSGGIMEVKLGELAVKKSKQESTQELGKMMIQDHSKANEEIRMLLQQRNIGVKDSLIKQHASKIKDFEKAKATEFDGKYIKEMQKDHREDISKFESQLNRTNHSGLKDFVTRTLPVLRKHQNHVETLVKEEM
jgi:putative membrane protein